MRGGITASVTMEDRAPTPVGDQRDEQFWRDFLERRALDLKGKRDATNVVSLRIGPPA